MQPLHLVAVIEQRFVHELAVARKVLDIIAVALEHLVDIAGGRTARRKQSFRQVLSRRVRDLDYVLLRVYALRSGGLAAWQHEHVHGGRCRRPCAVGLPKCLRRVLLCLLVPLLAPGLAEGLAEGLAPLLAKLGALLAPRLAPLRERGRRGRKLLRQLERAQRACERQLVCGGQALLPWHIEAEGLERCC